MELVIRFEFVWHVFGIRLEVCNLFGIRVALYICVELRLESVRN